MDHIILIVEATKIITELNKKTPNVGIKVSKKKSKVMFNTNAQDNNIIGTESLKDVDKNNDLYHKNEI